MPTSLRKPAPLIGEVFEAHAPHTGWYVRVLRYASGRKLPTPRILVDVSDPAHPRPFGSRLAALDALQTWKAAPRSITPLKPATVLSAPVSVPKTDHAAMLRAALASAHSIPSLGGHHHASETRTGSAVSPTINDVVTTCHKTAKRAAKEIRATAAPERNWLADVVTVRWSGKDRLAIKLGRSRRKGGAKALYSLTRVAFRSMSGAVIVEDVPSGAVRPVDLVRYTRDDIRTVLTLMVEAGHLKPCERQSTLLAYDRTWKEARANVTRVTWVGTTDKNIPYRKHAGPLPAHLIEVASLTHTSF